MAIRLLLLAIFVPAICPTAWAQGSAGGEFRINSYTTGNQTSSAVAADANGNFVVVWASYQDGSSSGVFAQRFNAAGVPRGSEFRVNSYTTDAQLVSSVASDANGNFVVVWESYDQLGNGFDIFGQRFDASGLLQGSEFPVNTFTGSFQRFPSAASDATGNFVVVWSSAFADGNLYGVSGQRFDASGVRQGAEFRVNSYTTGDQKGPSAASDASGNFVVVWESSGQDGNSYGVFGQRFGASGLAQGSEFKVNTYTTGSQLAPSVASDANGSFVVVWQSNGQDGSNFGIFGQRFDASGVAQGAEFQANTYAAGVQNGASVASDANGSFVVAWTSDGQDGSGLGVFGRRFDSGGLPQGAEFQINSYTTSAQGGSAVAAQPNESFVVAWTSIGQDGSGSGIFGQRYDDLIFQDGFE